MIFLCVKSANTKIQIHKYTNTAYDKLPERPTMWDIFEEAIIQGYLLSLAQLYKVWVFPLLADQDADIKVQMFVLRKDTADILGRKKKLD